jgi:site-specific recombinase XerD
MARLIEVCSEALTEPSDGSDAPQPDEAIPSSPMPTAPTSPAPTTQPLTAANDDEISIIPNAVKAFLANCKTNGVKAPTIRKYRNSLNRLADFAQTNNIRLVSDMKVTDLDRFRAGRQIAPITSQKELETLRQFWSYCVARDLCKENIALKVRGPTIISPNDVEPYSTEEVERIIVATQEFGRNQYERKRAKAIILTLRYTALRIGDVAVLRRDRVTKENGRWVIFVRATKNNKRVYLPIPRQMKEALDAVPIPREAASGCPYYFWSGNSKVRSIVGMIGECVSAVFRKSGVEKAHAHRFRHTLATELLAADATFEEVADVLGDSVEVIKKHYAKWSSGRQARVTDLLSRVHGNADWSLDRSDGLNKTSAAS